MSQLELFAPAPTLNRFEAVELLRPYIDSDLRLISDRLKVSTAGETIKNSGWAGHTVEWLLGSAPNNEQAADFGDWELKVTTVSSRAQAERRSWRARTHVTLTSFQLNELIETPFGASHLYEKTRHLLLVCREHINSDERSSPLVMLVEYDLVGQALEELKREYEALRWAVREYGVEGLSHVQTERLGAQGNKSTRGGGRFIARRRWVSEMIEIGLRHTQRDTL